MTYAKMICAITLVSLGWFSFAEAEEPRLLPKPDYSELQGKDFDPRLETAIEGMRQACHDLYDLYRETGGDWTRNLRSTIHDLRRVVCRYALLLHEAGLDSAIDELSQNDKLNDMIFDWYDMGPEGYTFRDYVKIQRAFRTPEQEKTYRRNLGWERVTHLRLDPQGFFMFPYLHSIDLHDLSEDPFFLVTRDKR